MLSLGVRDLKKVENHSYMHKLELFYFVQRLNNIHGGVLRHTESGGNVELAGNSVTQQVILIKKLTNHVIELIVASAVRRDNLKKAKTEGLCTENFLSSPHAGKSYAKKLGKKFNKVNFLNKCATIGGNHRRATIRRFLLSIFAVDYSIFDFYYHQRFSCGYPQFERCNDRKQGRT